MLAEDCSVHHSVRNFMVSRWALERRRVFRDLAPYFGKLLGQRRIETPVFQPIRQIVSLGGRACPIDLGADGRELP